jgi:hypothetical protein
MLALAQLLPFSRVPLAAAVATVGAVAGAFAAHAHGYPGRFSVHLVPLATAVGVLALSSTCSQQRSVTGTVPLTVDR